MPKLKTATVANNEVVRHAEGRIQLAIDRVAGKYRFHARVLERFVVRSRLSVPTMGVTAHGDDVLLLHNPNFVLSIPLDELVGVLLHEVNHVALGHILNDPADFPDEWARIVAEEVTVNEFVAEPLPATPILLCQFPGLPPMESTRQRYERLRRELHRTLILDPAGAVIIAFPGAESAAVSSGGHGSASVLDDHSVWRAAVENLNRAEGAIRAVLHDAATAVAVCEVPEYLRRALAAMGVGWIAGDGRYEISGSGEASLPWTRLLHRYAGQYLRSQPDYRRPPRRFPDLVGMVPGKRRRADRPRVMAVLDTSGSVTPDLLEQISAELGRLASSFAVTVVECDAAIHDVYPYRPLKAVTGRGGTNFRPPLEVAFLKKIRPDLIVYFTDGFGEAPGAAPAIPLIWCLTAGGERPATWGRVIQMQG